MDPPRTNIIWASHRLTAISTILSIILDQSLDSESYLPAGFRGQAAVFTGIRSHTAPLNIRTLVRRPVF